MAFDPQPAVRTHRRAFGISGSEGAQKTKRQSRCAPAALTANPPPAAPASSATIPGSPILVIEDQLELLWDRVQRQMLELLTHGAAAPFQQRAFDKLGYAMKHYGKLSRERAEEMRAARPQEPDADELASILNKMDRRIDELAQDRFKRLAQRELYDAAADGCRAGMDVQRQDQTQ
jgi:hypothetical protein